VGRQANASLVATLVAAFNALLHRLTGQADFVIGLPAAGQAQPGFAGLVGHCVNTLPLRMKFDPNAPFLDLIRTSKRAILDSWEHQILSFGGLLQKLQLPRDPSRIPLMPVLFNIDPVMKLADLGPAKTRLLTHPRAFDSFEMFVNGTETPEGLVLETTYNTSLFSRQTILHWLDCFRELLRGCIANPSQPVSRLPVLSETDGKRLLIEWNATQRPLPDAPTALAMFEAQARRTPDAVAVRDADSCLTYRELDQFANHIGHRLIGKGVQPEDLVGVCVERSARMVAALLGIWKAQAAYVPLDPDYPENRLAYIVKDANLRVLITERALHEVLSSAEVERLWLDEERQAQPSAPCAPGRPDQLAYVLHTSGSTGQPKGVQIEQRNLVNFLASMAREPGLDERDVIVAVTTLSFDIAGLELYLPLVVGAQTVIATREDAIDGARLTKLIATSAATLLQATPATWRMLVEAGFNGVPGFRGLCGGEALPRELARELLSRCEGGLWNVYGPTETTVWSLCERVPSVEGAISIGRPVDNTTLYIVDEFLAPVPVGAVGELLIGGLGVGRGYLNRPDLTAERFVPDTFADAPGSRLYRTGDLARYDNSGRVFFQRRNDGQVKVRGFRVELGEIETAFDSHPDVGQSVAMVREFGPGDARLVTYVAGRSGTALSVEALREHVASRLPQYMVPQHIVTLEAFPLTPNGKVDRKALPAPSAEAGTGKAHVPPATPVQEALANIWTELLRLSRVSVRDSFFDLGGHSMLAARMLTRIRDTMGVELPMRTIFQAQTIESLAARIEAAGLVANQGSQQPAGPREDMEF
jgi:amino acid adenylation domain-containing protein